MKIYVLALKEGDDDREPEDYELFLNIEALRDRVVDVCRETDGHIPTDLFKWNGGEPFKFECGNLRFRMYESWANS